MQMLELDVILSNRYGETYEVRKMAFNPNDISYIGPSSKRPKERSFLKMRNFEEFFEIRSEYTMLLAAVRGGARNVKI